MKVRFYYFVVILLAFFMSTTAWSGEKNIGKTDNEIDFLYDFLEGEYLLIGKLPDSNKTYSGKVTVKRSPKGLEVVRYVENKKIMGLGRIEYATADKRNVLRVRFKDERREYEATYVICSDLDNYARLTGYLYHKNKGTKVPGLEAWFVIKKQAPS